MKSLTQAEQQILYSFTEHAVDDGATVTNIGNLIAITWRDFHGEEFSLVFELHEATKT